MENTLSSAPQKTSCLLAAEQGWRRPIGQHGPTAPSPSPPCHQPQPQCCWELPHWGERSGSPGTPRCWQPPLGPVLSSLCSHFLSPCSGEQCWVPAWAQPGPAGGTAPGHTALPVPLHNGQLETVFIFSAGSAATQRNACLGIVCGSWERTVAAFVCCLFIDKVDLSLGYPMP